MKDFGFIRVAAATPKVRVARPSCNADEAIRMMREMGKEGVSLAVFPELSISGCSCADLFTHGSLVKDCEDAVSKMVEASMDLSTIAVVGAPVAYRGRLFNCAIVIGGGEIQGIVPKCRLGAEQARWFDSGSQLSEKPVFLEYADQEEVIMGRNLIFELGRAACCIEMGDEISSALPPCQTMAPEGVQLIIGMDSAKEIDGSAAERRLSVSSSSRRLRAAYIYSSSGYGETTQDAVRAGASLICENGEFLAEGQLFRRDSHYIAADVDIDGMDKLRSRDGVFKESSIKENCFPVDMGWPIDTDFSSKLLRKLNPHPFLPADYERRMSSLVCGLCTRMEHIGCRKAVIGVSGGLDSTLALIVTAAAFDTMKLPRENIIGITMPGFGTSKRTHGNSEILMETLGITSREISIVPATRQHFSDIGHDEAVQDLTYENSQARERTQILMDMAGKEGGIVIGTGDLSELALGWCTYNGDHMSMYAVNAGIPKTLVHALVMAASEQKGMDPKLSAVLKDIADTPISPELVPTDSQGDIKQKTEDLVGPYELHDFFIYQHMVNCCDRDKIGFLALKAFEGKYDKDTIDHWLETFMRRFKTQQFKRSCLPDGPQTEKLSLSPRGGWMMPSDL